MNNLMLVAVDILTAPNISSAYVKLTEKSKKYSVITYSNSQIVWEGNAVRRRRSLFDTTGIENVFLSWAQTVSRLSPRRQAMLKLTIADLLSTAQSDELEDQEQRRNEKIVRDLSRETNLEMEKYILEHTMHEN